MLETTTHPSQKRLDTKVRRPMAVTHVSVLEHMLHKSD